MVGRILVFLILAATWIVLSGKFDLFHLSLGLFSCAFITWISGDLVFENQDVRFLRWFRQTFGFLLFIPWLLWEILLANIEVLKLALSPRGIHRVRPRIVSYRTHLRALPARIMFANCITLTPGTITIKLEGDRLFVHAINETMAQGLGGTMERKIARIFGEPVR